MKSEPSTRKCTEKGKDNYGTLECQGLCARLFSDVWESQSGTCCVQVDPFGILKTWEDPQYLQHSKSMRMVFWSDRRTPTTFETIASLKTQDWIIITFDYFRDPAPYWHNLKKSLISCPSLRQSFSRRTSHKKTLQNNPAALVPH